MLLFDLWMMSEDSLNNGNSSATWFRYHPRSAICSTFKNVSGFSEELCYDTWCYKAEALNAYQNNTALCLEFKQCDFCCTSLNVIISLFYNIINRWLKKPCCKGLSDDCPVPCGVNCVAAVPLLSHFGQDNIQNDSCCVSSDFVVCFLTLHHNFTPCKSSSPSGC